MSLRTSLKFKVEITQGIYSVFVEYSKIELKGAGIQMNVPITSNSLFA